MTDAKWQDIPCFVINMDRCADRLEQSMTRVHNAGFRNVTRWRAIDAKVDDLSTAWSIHCSKNRTFTQYPGEQGCALSHLNLWKHIIEHQIPKAVVFEDDVLFHSDWDTLAPQYFAETPNDWDILYLGSQIDGEHQARVIQTRVYCTHAYMVTLQGAKKLYDFVLNATQMCVIDCILRDGMLMETPPFVWYVWNGMMYPDSRRGTNPHWVIRNTGLVYQDDSAGTFVKPRGP